MEVAVRYLADKSALARSHQPAVATILSPLISAGQIATCSIVELEDLFSARNHDDFVRTRASRALAYFTIPTEQRDFDRATDVMQELARRGHHRAVKIPDLLIAAIAERGRLVVLHYDADYDLIAEVTHQPAEWVVPRGSIP